MPPHSLPNNLKNASTRRPRLLLRAPAKVNLALAVGPPREGDGYHPICSWMTTLTLADDLDLIRLEDDRLSRYAVVWAEEAPRPSPIDWAITTDLAVRAHALLEQEAGRTLPVQMKLVKRTPVGGGLGGGSSDAAAMLVGVSALFGLGLSVARLRELAMKLGSDVAFFLADSAAPAGDGGDPSHAGHTGRTALVEGLGERVTPLPPPAPSEQSHLVLLFPEFGCPTGAVYRAFDALGPAPMRDRDVHRIARSGVIDADALFNDLAPAAEAVEPRLRTVRLRASEIAQRSVHVTGSGSTLFIACGGSDDASGVKSALDRAGVGVGTMVVRAGV